LEAIMKSLVYAVIAATALTASAAAMAQDLHADAVTSTATAVSGQSLTRAQVRAELVALEKAGFNPGLADASYPADVQAAEARVHAGDASYGPQTAEVSDAGGAPRADDPSEAHASLYGGGR
jgi:hypothetical protein